MNNNSIKKIVIIGPESTGKSTLCEQLALHYTAAWCPEYAREYLLAYGTKYTYDDLLKIAKGQIGLEERYTQLATGLPVAIGRQQAKKQNTKGPHDARLIFIDTDMYVMKVWCEFVFGKCHKWILEQIVNRNYHLYLLCKTDLPWVKDELREYPDLKTREKIYRMYKDLMINQQTPWTEISGDHDQRLKKAITSVDRLLAG